ncbi:hypothetical protein Ahy_A04g017694 [Arachis hypogaea]|uniref:Uncharacterized protein n=1 Tax=Arachis hypogaea TaxID=3818 RepID=A0A445DBS5_ARAHY|nr:hypothetical protein Ahy_A04g017694 [Arachis hypogaea]
MVNSQLEYSIFQTYSFIFGRKPKSQRCTTCIVDWKPILALEIAFMMKFLTIFRLENLAFLSLGNYFFEEQFELDLNPNLDNEFNRINHLDLHGSNLQGEIPYFLFTLENLTSLDLSSNWLEGQIELDMLSKLEKLTSLVMGEKSPVICNLESLVQLDLSYNNLADMILPCVGSFSRSLQIEARAK